MSRAFFLSKDVCYVCVSCVCAGEWIFSVWISWSENRNYFLNLNQLNREYQLYVHLSQSPKNDAMTKYHPYGILRTRDRYVFVCCSCSSIIGYSSALRKTSIDRTRHARSPHSHILNLESENDRLTKSNTPNLIPKPYTHELPPIINAYLNAPPSYRYHRRQANVAETDDSYSGSLATKNTDLGWGSGLPPV